MSKYYCCTQSNHGHDYRYVFTESQIWEGFGYVPKKFDYEDIYWPIGGSNSSATLVNKIVDTVEDVFAWLWSPCDGPDADDPMMIDYAEYCMSVATDEGVAGKILKRYNLNPEDMEQDAPDFEEVKTMFEKVFGIPFNEGAYHQEFRDIRRSALEELFIQKFSSPLITFENTHRDSEPKNGIVDCICIDGYPAEGEKSMKAWSAFTDYGGGYSAIVFADTAGKARQKAQSTDACEDADWCDIRVKRLPKLDGMEDREPKDNPWLNDEIRLILVKDYDWACVEPQYSDCDSCIAKQYCHWHDDE